MSFIEEHYEKVAIGVGAIVLAGGVYLGITAVSNSSTFANVNNGKSNGVPPEGTLKGKVNVALNSLSEEHDIIKKLDPATDKTELYLLKSVPLHGRNDSLDLLELNNPSAKNIHEEIPNSWFFENGLTNEMNYANAVELDSDKDGFSNIEEFKAGTNPTSLDSHPELLPRLRLENVDSSNFILTFTEINKETINLNLKQRKPAPLRFSFKLALKETGPVKKMGSSLGTFENRFTFERKQSNRGFQGAKITLKDNASNGRLLEFNRRDKFEVTDLKAYVYLDALGQGNEEAYLLQKGDKFGLPFASKKKTYEVVDIILEEGSKSNHIVKILDENGQQHILKR